MYAAQVLKCLVSICGLVACARSPLAGSRTPCQTVSDGRLPRVETSHAEGVYPAQVLERLVRNGSLITIVKHVEPRRISMPRSVTFLHPRNALSLSHWALVCQLSTRMQLSGGETEDTAMQAVTRSHLQKKKLRKINFQVSLPGGGRSSGSVRPRPRDAAAAITTTSTRMTASIILTAALAPSCRRMLGSAATTRRG